MTLYYKSILEIVEREILRMVFMFLVGFLVYNGVFYCNFEYKVGSRFEGIGDEFYFRYEFEIEVSLEYYNLIESYT